MKKYHLYLWIIALVGLMTSCSQDETDALQTATESNRVTLTASLPEDFAQIGTRALPAAPANHKIRCILEVWDTEDTPALKIRKEICPAAGDTEIDFSFDLATAGTYKALLWADYIPANQGTSSKEIAGLTGVVSYGNMYYTTTNGLKEVTIGNNIPQKPEVVDAFFASAEFTKAEKALTIPTITLTRPFMKLTIAEKNADRFASCERVTVEFSSPSKFDVATGTVIETKSRNITAANEFLNYGNDITIGGKTCETLICLYLFANEADATMGDIKLEFTSSDPNKSLPTVTIPAGIPLKRNYCVNAAGNLIGEPSSSTVNMTVDINSDWTKPDVEYDTEVTNARKILDLAKTEGTGNDATAYHYTIDTPEQLAALSTLANADAVITGSTNAKYSKANYKLSGNIDLKNKPWTPIGTEEANSFKGTFEGNGYHISNLNVSTAPAGLFGYLYGGTVRNLRVSGNVITSGNYAGGIAGRSNNSTIENCIFNGDVKGGSYVGGIAGINNGDNSQIAGCYTKGNVTATNSYAGGIVGENNGSNTVIIKNCYSQAEITVTDGYAGGIAGNNAASGIVSNCYATGIISGQQKVGGIAGYNYMSTVNGCFALSSQLKRTSGVSTDFKKITDFGTISYCLAFKGMVLMDFGGSSSSITGESDLTAAQCLSKALYTDNKRNFTEATDDADGWVFDTTIPTWQYLPWNSAFAKFPNIAVADYRISVPQHISSAVTL